MTDFDVNVWVLGKLVEGFSSEEIIHLASRDFDVVLSIPWMADFLESNEKSLELERSVRVKLSKVSVGDLAYKLNSVVEVAMGSLRGLQNDSNPRELAVAINNATSSIGVLSRMASELREEQRKVMSKFYVPLSDVDKYILDNAQKIIADADADVLASAVDLPESIELAHEPKAKLFERSEFEERSDFEEGEDEE